MAVAEARSKRLVRQPGQRPKADRLAPTVLVLAAQVRRYRRIGREVGPSKNIVAAILKRNRTARAESLSRRRFMLGPASREPRPAV